jgi:hypothetical protein
VLTTVLTTDDFVNVASPGGRSASAMPPDISDSPGPSLGKAATGNDWVVEGARKGRRPHPCVAQKSTGKAAAAWRLSVSAQKQGPAPCPLWCQPACDSSRFSAAPRRAGIVPRMQRRRIWLPTWCAAPCSGPVSYPLSQSKFSDAESLSYSSEEADGLEVLAGAAEAEAGSEDEEEEEGGCTGAPRCHCHWILGFMV